MMDGHFDVKIIPSSSEHQDFATWVEPIATKLLEVFLNCWEGQLHGTPCTHNPRHEDIHITGGQGRN